MGKLIQFPIARLPRPERHAALPFDAFSELRAAERAQLKLLAACTAAAGLLIAALQLATS